MDPTSWYEPDPIKSLSQSRGARRNDLLPFEILGAIFHHVRKSNPFDLRSLLFVCKSWRNAVCHHSSSWSEITLDHTVLWWTIFPGITSRWLSSLVSQVQRNNTTGYCTMPRPAEFHTARDVGS
jgi:hypothetical protein